MTLDQVIAGITPADTAAMERAKARWDSIAKPLGSLGALEEAVIRIAGMTGSADVDISKRAVVDMFSATMAVAPMREAVRAAVAGGLPTVAECGGFLYLNRLLSDGEGRDWPMAGALPGRAANTGRLGRFGYVTLTAKKDGLLGPAGTRLPAHEFHYWDSDAPGSDFRADKPQSSRGWDCAFHTPTLYAGFPHFHFWAAPSAARNFVAAARRYVQEASL